MNYFQQFIWITTVGALIGLLVWLSIRGNKSRPGGATENSEGKQARPRDNTTLWLLVGLAPIPIFLIGIPLIVHTTTFPAILFGVCALCSLVGGVGCAGTIKNIGLRILTGLFLAVIFLLLSWVIAALQACSGIKG